MARQALAARQRVLGPEHPDTLASMSNLSIQLAQLGQHEAAADMARQALAAQQRVLGPEHPDSRHSMSVLRWLGELDQREAAAEVARHSGDLNSASGNCISWRQRAAQLAAIRGYLLQDLRCEHVQGVGGAFRAAPAGRRRLEQLVPTRCARVDPRLYQIHKEGPKESQVSFGCILHPSEQQ